jgi:hypothetical protein
MECAAGDASCDRPAFFTKNRRTASGAVSPVQKHPGKNKTSLPPYCVAEIWEEVFWKRIV